jgi:putative SOS response-associated peptidase YedK
MASCTIIVTDANALTRPIHDRMPVLLDKADIESWLNGTGGTELLRPAAVDRVREAARSVLDGGEYGVRLFRSGRSPLSSCAFPGAGL